MKACQAVRTAAAAAVLCAAGRAAVLDRIAVVVGNDVITESEVLEEVRMTEFLNGQPLNVSPAQRRAAAERMVDQQLIRDEMQIGSYSEPAESAVDATLAEFRRQRFAGDDAAMRASLQAYGLTESDLKKHLRWQLAAVRFANVRFHAGIPVGPREAGASAKPATREQQLDDWLKDKRASTKIRLIPEAFQ
jgi:parvulin-like peptidyl-prolyl isomerase